MKVRSLLIICVMVSSGSAAAQTACPGGVSAGSAQCGPSGGGFYMPPPPPRQPHWKLTWGAIALSSEAHMGTSVGQSSKRKAVREAIGICSSQGGKDCRVTAAYKNQCAVVAWPTVPGGDAITTGAGSIEIATDIALQECSESQGGGSCTIVYSECTEPVLVR